MSTSHLYVLCGEVSIWVLSTPYIIAGSLYLFTTLTHFMLPSSSITSGICQSVLWACFLKIPHVSEICLSLWLTSFSIMPSRSNHLLRLPKDKIFFLFNGFIISQCICIPHLFIHSPTDTHLGYLHVSAMVSNAAVSTGVHKSFWAGVFIFFGYTARSGVAGSYGNYIFNLLRNLLFYKEGAPIYIPINSGQGLAVLRILASICLGFLKTGPF